MIGFFRAIKNMRTLHIRMKKHGENAMYLAKSFEKVARERKLTSKQLLQAVDDYHKTKGKH